MKAYKKGEYEMKKLISFSLCLLIVLSCSATAFAEEGYDSFGAYEHIFIIGVDGGGSTFSKMDTPNFDRIFADNAYCYDSVTEYETASAQNWGSILTGVGYETHGITNDVAANTPRTSESEYHSLFYYTRQAFPDAELASFVHWGPINYGIVENDLGVNKYHRKWDPMVVEHIQTYLSKGNVPKLMFVQLDNMDHEAHKHGGFSDEYYKSAERMDTYIGDIYDAIESRGLMENSLFIVVADHGETAGGHGGQTPEESEAMLAVAGHSVNKTILSQGVHNRDVSAITLYALGIEQPECFVTSVPQELFGKSREKNVEPLPFAEQILRKFIYAFMVIANLVAGSFVD